MSTLLATAAVDEIARRATEHQRDFHRVITACGEWSCDDVLALVAALREASSRLDRLLVHLHEAGRREGTLVVYDAVSMIDAMATAQGPIQGGKR